jgi:hypothetical protein
VPYKEVGDTFVPYMEVMLSSRFERLGSFRFDYEYDYEYEIRQAKRMLYAY